MWWHTRRNQISSFGRNGRVHLNRQGRQFSRLLAAEVCASAVVMLDTPCSEVVWRVLATHSIHQFPIHFPTRATPCAITFQLDSNNNNNKNNSRYYQIYRFTAHSSYRPDAFWLNVSHHQCLLISYPSKSMYIYIFLFSRNSPPVGHGLLIHEVSRSHTMTQHSR